MKNSILRTLRRLRRSAQRGWTFMEVLIVIGIVIILSSFVGFMAFKYIDQARQAASKSQIEIFSLALQSYYLNCRAYPATDEGLKALREKPASAPDGWNGPYIDKAVPKDPWGRDYQYSSPGPDGNPFLILSWGADGKEGGEGADKDIKSTD